MKIMIADVKSNILDEVTKQLVVFRNNKMYFGALFWEPIDETIVNVIETRELNNDATTLTILSTAYKLVEKHNMLAKDGKTYSTMCHWAYINGLVDDYIRV